jgi:hypothetical protein
MSSQRARIAARAHELWEQRGRPDGSPEVDWYAAEKEISGGATEPRATFDPMQRDSADAPMSAADSGPGDTETTSPDGPISTPSRASRNGGQQGRRNGATQE